MTHEQLGTLIDQHSCLNTTADTLKFLRRHNTDAYILDALEYCSIGNKRALYSLLYKIVSTDYGIEDKIQLDNQHRED